MTQPHHPAPPRRGRLLPGLALILLALALILPGTALAQEDPPARDLEIATTADYAVEAASLETRDGKLPLSLEDAIVLALQRNLSLQVQRYSTSQNMLRILENRGIYDFNLSGTLETSTSTSTPTSALVEAESVTADSARANAGISRLVPFGGTVSLNFNNRFTETNNLAETVSPSYSAFTQLSLSTPLLRGLGRLATEQQLILARNNAGISHEDFEIQVVNLVQQVSDAYWDLVAARESLAVTEESLNLAREQQKMNKVQVEVGTMAPLVLVESESRVADRERDIIQRTAAVEDAEDLLRQLVNLADGPLWDTPINTVTEPETAFKAVNTSGAIQEALNSRPELRRQRLTIRNSEIQTKFARNQKKPSLRLDTNYNISGIGGDERERGTGVVLAEGGYDDAFDRMIDRVNDGWTATLTLAYPIENRTAKARLAIAELGEERDRTELSRLEQDIMREVRRTARGVQTAERQIEAAKVAVRLNQQNLDAEQKRYENGISTNFAVLEAQERLTNAKQQEVNAVIGYRKSLVAFDRARSALLDEVGVRLAEQEE